MKKYVVGMDLGRGDIAVRSTWEIVNGRPHLLVVHYGESADVYAKGTPQEVGQLLEAATRALTTDDE